ncbi:MAG: hypothetical protein ACI8VW_001700 [bacterium]|jgi:hypothetical protein
MRALITGAANCIGAPTVSKVEGGMSALLHIVTLEL